MAINSEINCSGVYQRMGTYEHEQHYFGELDPTTFADDEFMLWLNWPKDQYWLSVGVDQERVFAKDVEAHNFFGWTREQLQPGGDNAFFDKHRSIALLARRRTKITLRISINTDDRGFENAVQSELNRGRTELIVPIIVCAITANNGGKPKIDRGQIVLKLKPLERLPAYTGVIAFDLGNTNSAVACLDVGRNRTREVKILAAAGGAWSLSADSGLATIPSHVRVDEIFTWDVIDPIVTRRFPSLLRDEFAPAVHWTIGALATIGTQSPALVLGAKRLMVGRRCEETHSIKTFHNILGGEKKQRGLMRIDFVNRAAAELLACQLLREFARAKGDDSKPVGWPQFLAVTYPTTFSPQEIDRLRRNVYRAWLRLQFKPQSLPEAKSTIPPKQPVAKSADDLNIDRTASQIQQRLARAKMDSATDDPLIGLLLDEASAAAFFFLYRKVFEFPGGLPGFADLYPDGLNLLLYDCGGGTTDVALVCAHVDQAKNTRLRISIRGRTGVRYFGGDNITLAVARLLKAKLARAIAQNQGNEGIPATPTPPDDGGPPWKHRKILNDYLDKIQPTADELVPTRFEPDVFNEDTLDRRDRAATLWNWAQVLKHQLENSETVSLHDIDIKIGPGHSKLSDSLLCGYPAESPAQTNLSDELSNVSISRWEVDALIGPEVVRSVLNCNELIEDFLSRPPNGRRDGVPMDEGFVHWVVVTGNGSRYPLIRQLLQDRLEVPFPGDDSIEVRQEKVDAKLANRPRPGWRLEIDRDNMKNAVAKGAALALAAKRGMVNAVIHFDTDMSACLPFDVSYWHRTDQDVALFKSGTRYDELRKQTVPIAAIASETDVSQHVRTKFSLKRRFPGDGANPAPDDGIPEDPNRGWAPYLTFDFGKKGIQGDLEVSYNLESQQFVARDMKSGEFGKPREDGPEEGYIAPAQSGKL